jgi:hypothetical protein
MATFSLANAVNSMASSHNGMMPMYPGANPLHSRQYASNQYPNINTQAACAPTWTVPCSEEASPGGEHYGLDQAYVSNHNSMSNVYGGRYWWGQPGQKAFLNGSGVYLDQENAMTSSYATNDLPYVSTSGLRLAVTTEAVSPLNMKSLHSSLSLSSMSARPHPRQMADSLMSQQHLPIPHSTRASVSTSMVDQLQTRSLPSTQMMNVATTLKTNGEYTKAAVSGNTDLSDTDADMLTSELGPPPISKGYSSMWLIANGPNLTYVTDSTPTSPGHATMGSGSQLNFSTSTLLESMPAPASGATHSNFRKYTLPTSSSTETVSVLSNENSHANLYSYITDNASKRSLGDSSGESNLVSGQSYSPLGQPSPQRSETYESLGKDSFGARNASTHRTSLLTVDRSY